MRGAIWIVVVIVVVVPVPVVIVSISISVAIVAVMTMCGLAVAYLMPPVYRASAKVLVEAPQIPEEMARPTVLTSAVEQLQIIEQEITTRENLLALASRLDIYGPKLATLTESEIKAALDGDGRFLCTVHANDELTLDEDAAAPG